MIAATTAVVAGGALLAVSLGLHSGFDATLLAILVLIVALGVLAAAATRRIGTGRIAPALCAGCGGLISPSSPYCKHCGARQPQPTSPEGQSSDA